MTEDPAPADRRGSQPLSRRPTRRRLRRPDHASAARCRSRRSTCTPASTACSPQVTLQQTFVNTHDEPLEATYIFPLPDRAAVTRFRLEVAGRVVEGVLKERGAARREYDQAIQAGHRAAITEEERPGVFTMRVGNLPPGEAATVRLTLAGPLPYSDGEATFRFPLVVAPRYIPGTPLPGRRSATARPPTPTPCPTPRASARRCCCPASRTRCG